MHDDLLALLAARNGHFRFESGHHGTRWLDLELLFLHPRRMRPFAAELARRLSARSIEAVCGPLVEGAFVAQMVADELDLPFSYAQPVLQPDGDGLYPVDYQIPAALRPTVRGQAIAIVTDVINAGSAVRGTVADLQACGARPIAIGALLVLGEWATGFAANEVLHLEAIARLLTDLWTPAECPLCASGVPLDSGAEVYP
jgi:orotate phosphoribosyltransferase